MKNNHILVCDDDRQLCSLVCEYLSENSLIAVPVYNGKEALNYLQKHKVDLIVLDLMMPVLDGLETLKLLKEQYSEVAVIMLTAKSESIDKILSLEIGADDYLVKPHHPRELLARIRSILRRVKGLNIQKKAKVIKLGELSCNSQLLVCQFKNKKINLTDTEFLVLRFLMESYPNIADKEQMAEECLNRQLHNFDRSLDVHISKIRHKLKECKADHFEIKNIRSRGYLLREIDTSNE